MNPLIEELKKQIENFESVNKTVGVGTVLEIGDGVARVTGLSDVMASEMIEFGEGEHTTLGVALNLEEDSVGAIILGDFAEIKEGTEAIATRRILEVPVGEMIIGRVINPLGEALDGKGKIESKKFYPIEKVAPGVITRQGVNQPVQTGIKAIDAMIPVGRGQRELIIGDRQIGKTAIAIDTIINQKGRI